MKIFGDNVWIMSNIYSEYVPNRPIQLSGPTLQLVHMLRLVAAANKAAPMPADDHPHCEADFSASIVIQK